MLESSLSVAEMDTLPKTVAAPRESPSASTSVPGYELHISRVFDAPRDLVWKAWTDPALLGEWMGPRGFTAMDIKHDLRVGGKWRLRLHRTDAVTGCDTKGQTEFQTDLWMHGVYLEIVPPERAVYTFAWEGRVNMAPLETTITVTFRELEGKTVMDFKQGPFLSAEDRDNHNTGWSSAFDRFAEFLLAPIGAEKSYDLVIERVFDAPRDLVWSVWTDGALASEWMGPRGFTATHFEQDPTPGGKWRLCLHSDGFDTGDGPPRKLDLWQGGVFREIVPPEHIVYTFAWDDPAGVGLDAAPHETLITVQFEEQGGKTKMVFRQEFFPTAGERDGHNGGWNSAFDRFAELVQAKARRTQ
ncbi:MAG: SRPBCC domain-containing protein [Acidobacteriaceae bacterium]